MKTYNGDSFDWWNNGGGILVFCESTDPLTGARGTECFILCKDNYFFGDGDYTLSHWFRTPAGWYKSDFSFTAANESNLWDKLCDKMSEWKLRETWRLPLKKFKGFKSE